MLIETESLRVFLSHADFTSETVLEMFWQCKGSILENALNIENDSEITVSALAPSGCACPPPIVSRSSAHLPP